MKFKLMAMMFILAGILACRPAAAAGSASPQDLAKKLCAAEQAADPDALLALMHPDIYEMFKSMMSFMGDDPAKAIMDKLKQVLTTEPVKSCEIVAAGEKPCPQDVLDSLNSMLQTPPDACGEVDLKLSLATDIGAEEASEHDNLIRVGGAWYVGDTEVGGRKYKIVLPEESEEQKTASIAELNTYGTSLCAALKKGEPEEIFGFLHPATIEFLKGFVLAFAEEGQTDPWADFLAEQRAKAMETPIAACEVKTVSRTDCDMAMLQQLRSMLAIRADRCGAIEFGQTLHMGDEDFSTLSVFSESGKWYIAK